MFKTAALVSLIVTIAASGAQPDVAASSAGGWWGDLYDQKIIPFETVLKKPRSFVGQTVTFVAQFHRLGEIDNPFHTKFESDWYLNFSIWPDGAAIWDKKTYRNDYQYLFVRRGTDGSKELLQAPTYARYVIVAEVSDVFKGKPWLDVTGIKRLDTQMTEASLVHIVKGLSLRRIRRNDAAVKEFSLADGGHLPTYVRTMLLRQQGAALEAEGKTAAAILKLQAAHSMDQNDPATKAHLDRLQNTPPVKVSKDLPKAEEEKPATGKGADDSSKEAKGK